MADRKIEQVDITSPELKADVATYLNHIYPSNRLSDAIYLNSDGGGLYTASQAALNNVLSENNSLASVRNLLGQMKTNNQIVHAPNTTAVIGLGGTRVAPDDTKVLDPVANRIHAIVQYHKLLKSIPDGCGALKSIFTDPGYKRALINDWSTNPGNIPPNFNRLFTELNNAAKNAGAFRTVFQTALGVNPAGLIPPDMTVVSPLNGEARTEIFLNSNDFKETPAFINLFRQPVPNTLYANLKNHLQPSATAQPVTRDVLNQLAGANDTKAMNDLFTTAPFLLGAATALATPIDDNKAAELRGEARYQLFLTRPDVAGIPELRLILDNNTGDLRKKLITHLGKGNNAPDPATIAVLRDALVKSGDAAQARVALLTAFNGVTGFDDASLQAANVTDTTNVLKHLKGQARFEAFLARADVAASEELKTILQKPGIKGPLIAHLETKTDLPNPRQILQLYQELKTIPTTRDAAGPGLGTPNLTAAQTHAQTALTRTFTNPPFAFNNNDFKDAGVVSAATLMKIRGEARYADLMLSSSKELKTMPQLKTLLEDSAVKNALIGYWQLLQQPAPSIAQIQRSLSGIDLAASTIETVVLALTHAGDTPLPVIPGGGPGGGPPADFKAIADAITPKLITADLKSTLIIESQSSLYSADPAAAQVHLRNVQTQITDLETKINTVNMLLDPNTTYILSGQNRADLVALRDSLQNPVFNHLECKESIKKLSDEITKLLNSAEYAAVAASNNPLNEATPNEKKLISGLEGIKKIYDEVKPAITSLQTNAEDLKKQALSTFSSDERPNQYLRTAELYQKQAEKLVDTSDTKEIDRVLKNCQQMKDTIDITMGKLLEEKTRLEGDLGKAHSKKWRVKFDIPAIEEKIETLQKTKKILDKTITKLKTPASPVKKVNCFSTDKEVFTKGTPETDISDKISNYITTGATAAPAGGAGGGAAAPGAMGYIGTAASGVVKTTGFDTGDLRANYTTVQMERGSAYFASLQGNQDGDYRSKLYGNAHQVEKMPLKSLVKLAAIEVENFYAGMDDKSEPMVLRGSMPPRLVEAITTYCELMRQKGSTDYPAPITDIQKTESRYDFMPYSYKREFRNILKDPSLRDSILPGTRIVTGEEKTKLEESTKTKPSSP